MALVGDESAVRSTGKVSWFNDSKGFGFIVPDDDGEELFVHHSSIRSDGFRSLALGESVEFVITMGSDGKTKAVDVTAPGGGPLNKKREIARGGGGNGGIRRGGCYNCGEDGHVAKDCTGERSSGECYNCGDAGHFARDCLVQKVERLNIGGGAAAGGAGKECYTCGDVGHIARDCIQKLSAGGGGERVERGGNGVCYTCGGTGHIARDCATKKRSSGCYECGGTGHIARDCARRGTGGGRSGGGGGGNSKCYHCGNEGHFARDCSVA